MSIGMVDEVGLKVYVKVGQDSREKREIGGQVDIEPPTSRFGKKIAPTAMTEQKH
jgi:hypothetical protein